MTTLSSSPKSRPPHRRGTFPLLLLALTALLTLLQTTSANIVCLGPSGSAQVGDTIYFDLSDDGFSPTTGDIASVDATIRCANSGNPVVMVPSISNGASYRIPANILSACGANGQVYVQYDGIYYYSFGWWTEKEPFKAKCPGLTIQANPTAGPPSPSPSVPSSTAAPTTVTTALPTTSLAPTLSTLASTTTTARFSPNAASVSNSNSGPVATSNSDIQTNKGSASSKSSTTAIAGAVGGIAALAFVAFGLVVVRRRKERNQRRLSALGDGYPMKHRSEDGFGDDGYGFGTNGRGYVHSGMMSETTGQFGYGDYSQGASHSHSHSNNKHNGYGDTYGGYNSYDNTTPDPYYHGTMAGTTAMAGAGAGYGGHSAPVLNEYGYGGHSAPVLNEYMPPPPALMPTDAARLPAMPEPTYKEEYSSWDDRPTTTDVPVPTLTSTAAAAATGGAGATAAHNFDRYGVDAYSYDDEDPYGGQVIDNPNSNPNPNPNPHDSFQSLSNNTNTESVTDRDFFRRLRQSVASTAAGATEGGNRESAIDTDILPELPTSEFGFNGFSFPAPPTTAARVSSSIPASTGI